MARVMIRIKVERGRVKKEEGEFEADRCRGSTRGRKPAPTRKRNGRKISPAREPNPP